MSHLYAKISKDWKQHFMMYAAFSIIVSTCLGSIAVMSVFQHGNGFFQMLQVFLVVVVCNAVNASILTVQKPKIVLNSMILSGILCTVILVANLIF